MAKREREDSAAQVAAAFKHARVAAYQADEDGDDAVQAASAAPPSKLKGVRFPVEITVLPHILRQLEDFLLTPDEAMYEAAASGQVARVEELLHRFDCKLLDPFTLAAGNGHVAVVQVMLPELLKPRSEPDRDTWEAILDGFFAAGENVHLVILLVLRPFLTRARNRKRKYEAYETATHLLENAAGQGHLGIVRFMITHATSMYVNGMNAEDESLALERAISGKHMDVVEYLLNLDVAGFRLDFSGSFSAALDAGLSPKA
ncbi:hypothetical protein PHYSODRAFT_256494 [Phytophthora sojae]|uniref:Uncharacterized protein n=1 Tax=Phytophthora sojae (strain P6497) TaxID=1094619 RepID=G4ZGF4_PHYSP|nr:hypothetical protein PHYSODRAFT_256494 [Phytophthora sojae]EGZ18599.1 hypothetical protein PHYSODRAFT_256494 [Phytophthora sojae]|eukprot:XP_009527657.1 hypothetical protein PHYSODRAFT_256494 [Phytophthora sojae]